MSALPTTRSLPAVRGAEACPGVGGAEEPARRWVLRRNCATTPRQAATGLAVVVVACSGVTAFFAWQGAWLVVPFAGLELLAVTLAWIVHARHATDRDCVSLAPGRLTVERFDAEHVERQDFEPAWVQVAVGRGAVAPVELSSGSRRIAIGRHVSRARRIAVAGEIRQALIDLARSPATRPAFAPHNPDF